MFFKSLLPAVGRRFDCPIELTTKQNLIQRLFWKFQLFAEEL